MNTRKLWVNLHERKVNMHRLSILAAPLALVAASPAFAQAQSPGEYVATAGASDLFERESSRILLQSTSKPDLRSFAQMMIKDHTKSTAMVKAAALKSKVKAGPPKLNPAQSEQIAQLKGEHGQARDALYISQQKASHNQALAVQQAYASGGTAPALRKAAAEIVPVVKHHIALLAKM